MGGGLGVFTAPHGKEHSTNAEMGDANVELGGGRGK